jgi:glutamine cyclotransferase
MAKKRPKRRPGFPPAAVAQKTIRSTEQRPMRRGLIVLFLVISIGGTYLAVWLRQYDTSPRYTFKLIEKYPHDKQAFTQGLLFHDGFLWESTGRYGESTVRKIDLETGEIIRQHSLDDNLFGEGMVQYGDRLIQLTWKAGKALVYDMDLNPIEEFSYPGEGWGLATDGNDLILSDGSSVLKFIDPETFDIKKTLRVLRKGGVHVGQLNELEYAGGKVYANRYQYDQIYEIDINTGNVAGVIDLAGLWPMSDRPADGVLNGIAVTRDMPPRMFVTGKLCPFIYEIELVRMETR